jgi:hypothetical protein
MDRADCRFALSIRFTRKSRHASVSIDVWLSLARNLPALR